MTEKTAEYRVGDRLVSYLSGYVYKITEVNAAEQTVRFGAPDDPEDESDASFADIALTFRHVPAGEVSQ